MAHATEMQPVGFVKATACGNDFFLINHAEVASDWAGFTRKICDRHSGVGADGVEWVLPADDADLAIRLFNADGSEAEISGNGTRCVAAWYCAEHDANRVVIRTGAGLKTCELIERKDQAFEFRSAMGQPQVSGGDRTITLGNREVRGTPVSMGNPHFVVFVDEFESGWQEWSRQIAIHPDFPEGTNVELVKVLSPREIEVRFYERGVGETMSSGTGSCAAAVASIHRKVAQSPLRVHATGGTQSVEWDGEVFLTGPATLLCRGEFFV